MTDAELVEWALGQMPQSRANAPTPVTMVTTKTSITISFSAREDMVINWGDNSTTQVTGSFSSNSCTHTYSDNQPAHPIFFTGSNQALRSLDIMQRELIYLDVANNTELENLSCIGNELTLLDLSNCSKLKLLNVGGNNLSFIDLTDLPLLKYLYIDSNDLTTIDLSQNPLLANLSVRGNQLTTLDLSVNTLLVALDVSGMRSLTSINGWPLDQVDFAYFQELQFIAVGSTRFRSLDLSDNPLIKSIDVSYTEVSQLDVSSMQIEDLYASHSDLQNIYYGNDVNRLRNLWRLRIDHTPLESDPLYTGNLFLLLGALPDRNNPMPLGNVPQGQWHTSSLFIQGQAPYLALRNWVPILRP